MSGDNEEKDRNEGSFPFHNEGGGDQNQNKQPKRSKTPMLFLLVGILFFFIFVMNVLLQGNRDLKSFSEFRDRIISGEIKRVEMDSIYFRGYKTKKPERTKNSIDGWLNSLNPKDTEEYYETVGIFTDDFIQLLNEKKVIYSLKTK